MLFYLHYVSNTCISVVQATSLSLLFTGLIQILFQFHTGFKYIRLRPHQNLGNAFVNTILSLKSSLQKTLLCFANYRSIGFYVYNDGVNAFWRCCVLGVLRNGWAVTLVSKYHRSGFDAMTLLWRRTQCLLSDTDSTIIPPRQPICQLQSPMFPQFPQIYGMIASSENDGVTICTSLSRSSYWTHHLSLHLQAGSAYIGVYFRIVVP